MKIIIAVLCIILLIFLLASMYNAFTNKTEQNQARATLKQISDGINLLNANNQEKTVMVTTPAKWVFQYYSNGVPNQCMGLRCLCICPSETLFTNQLDKCNDGGICEPVYKDIVITNGLVIEIMDLVLKQESGKVSISKK